MFSGSFSVLMPVRHSFDSAVLCAADTVYQMKLKIILSCRTFADSSFYELKVQAFVPLSS